MSGDVVSNISLEPILGKHRARRELDKNAIMTIILREVGSNHRMRSKRRQPVFVVNRGNGRCLQYEETGSRSSDHHGINIDANVLKEQREVEIRGDLIDCSIDICTPDVLGLWSDNFDYTNLRRSFLHGVLKDYELNGKTIYTHIVDDEYAARVKNLRAYDVVSKDVLGRATYPLSPDSNLISGQTYQFEKGNIYRESDISVSRTAVLKRKVAVGSRTSIQDRSIIHDSTIGRNCQIGSDVQISHSYIWDRVTIGDGTKISRAVVACGAEIGKGCRIDPGALVSYGAILADGSHMSGVDVPSNARWKDQTGATRVRKGSSGVASMDPISPALESDDDSDVSSLLGASTKDTNSQNHLSDVSISEFSESDSDLESIPELSRRSSLRSDPSNESAPNRDFLLEATSDILEALQNGVAPDNIALELVGLRMKENASQHQVRQAVVTAFMRRISNLMDEQGLGAREAVKEVFAKNSEVIGRTLFDQLQEAKVDQVDFLLLLQKDAAGRPEGGSLLAFAAKELYDLEDQLMQEDGIMQWWKDDRSKRGDLQKVRASMEPFVTYLENAEEESDEESEEDSD